MGNFMSYLQLVRVGWVFVREGVIAALPADDLPPLMRTLHGFSRYLARSKAKEASRSDRLARAVARLGPSYVKLGQFLATRPDVVGADIAADLALLQDRMETFPLEQAMESVSLSIGRPISDAYVRIEPPIAAASIAQVHPAYLIKDGVEHKVAVKVARPGVRGRFRRDLSTFYFVSELLERHVPLTRRLRPIEVTRILEQTTRIEMDLRLEAAALSELGENTASDPGFRVPKVDWERTGRDVITMEWIDGIKMSQVDALREAGHDLDHLADVLIQSFLRHTLRDGFFHADMHQGNLFVLPGNRIAAIDFGIMGRIDRRGRVWLAEILYGLITGNYKRVAEIHFEAGYVPPHHSVEAFAQALRAVGEPVIGRAASQVSMGRLLGQLFEITALFDMHLRPELILLQKTMVSVEGVARRLNPDHDLWEAARPIVERWIRRELGPQAQVRDALEEIRATLKALSRLAQDPPGPQTIVIRETRTPGWAVVGVTLALAASRAALVLSLWPIMTG